MEYLNVENTGFNTTAKVEFPLYPQDFIKFVKHSDVDLIFVMSPENTFIKNRELAKKSMRFPYFTATNGTVVCFMYSMGYSDLESLEQSIENGSFYAINRLKERFHEGIWEQETGIIYETLTSLGYCDGEEIEEASYFLGGHMNVKRERFVECREAAKKGKFTTLKELCIAKTGEFGEIHDLKDAEIYKAPNGQALEAVRTLENISMALNLSDLSESLIAGVVVSAAAKALEQHTEPVFIDVHEIMSLYDYWFPHQPCDGFGKKRNEKEIVEFLESSRGNSLGHYDRSNHQLQFSSARIYLDGANIMFKGAYRGERRESLEAPDMSVLKSCYEKLSKEGLGIVKIIMDGLAARRIYKDDQSANNNILSELKRFGVLETTIKGEKADDVLLQKLRDDPFAYVVSNDSYVKDHSLTERDEKHLIRIEFGEGTLEFVGTGYELLKNWKTIFSELKGKSQLLYHTRELGVWPYTDGRFEMTYNPEKCC